MALDDVVCVDQDLFGYTNGPHLLTADINSISAEEIQGHNN